MKQFAASLSIIVLILFQSSAADLAPFEVSSSEMNSALGFNDLKLPKDFSVFAAGAYSGRKLPYTIDQSGHEATQIDVAVHETNKPVVLMLGAYEPTVWNIGWSTNTHIIAVLASGYHRQAIAGLEPNVPAVVSTADNKGPYGYFYVTPEKLESMNALARRVFARPVDKVFPARDGKVLVGGALPPGVTLVTSKETPPQSFFNTNAPLAGRLGLDDAVSKGILRKATQDDVDAWSKALCAASPNKAAAAKVSLLGVPCYVVLKSFVYPAGLYGGNSASFFVPKGVPLPTGSPAHCTIYDFNTLTAEGPEAR